MRIRFLVFVQCWLILPAPWAHAQNQPFAVKIRYGALDTTSYPSVNHPTEWKQELIADLYDSTGRLMSPDPGLVYVWGVDFCKGFGMGFGWVSGPGLHTISPDGNKIKVDQGCCPECPYQTYYVAVRILLLLEDRFLQSDAVRIPNIVLPTEHRLSMNFPNPFSLSTIIKFDLKQRAHAHLRVFDLLGRTVADLVNQYLAPGSYTRTWQPRNAAEGIYFYRLTITPDQGNSITFVEKMMLLK